MDRQQSTDPASRARVAARPSGKVRVHEDELGGFFRIDVEVLVAVHEHRLGTGVADGVDRGYEGDRGHDDLVARPYPQASRAVSGRGAIDAGHRMLCAGVAAHRFFEHPDIPAAR
jgi:hypothetical protein